MPAGRLVIPSWMPALNSDGFPIPNAQAFFYFDGTTTLQTVYADEDLLTPLANPVKANSSGRFPTIWADEDTVYSVTMDADYGPPGVPFTFSGITPSVDGVLYSVALAEAAAGNAEDAAALAVEAASSIIGSGLRFGPFTMDGVSTTIQMAQVVAAGNEWTVQVFANGVLLYVDDYSTNGTTTLTFDVAPANGVVIEGVHVGASIGLDGLSPRIATVPDGPLLTNVVRFSRVLDYADAPMVFKNGSTDDGPGIVAAYAYSSTWTHSSGVVRIMSNTTIPEGSVTTLTDGQIYVGAGITLTIYGAFNAPSDRQIFTGPGTVVGLAYAVAEWWGANGDFNESRINDPTYTSYTDNAPAFNKAVACVLGAGVGGGYAGSPRVQALDRAYGLKTPIVIQPLLDAPIDFIGANWTVDGSGTRFYSGDSAGCVMVTGGAPFSNPNAFVKFRLADFQVLGTANRAPVGVTIAGDGGATDKVLSGLLSNVIENVVVTDMATCFLSSGVTKLRAKNCTGLNGAIFGIGWEIKPSPGGTITSDVSFEGCIMSQPNSGGMNGRGWYIHNDDVSVGSPSLQSVRGISFDDDCQGYAGRQGISVFVFGVGAVGKSRNIGDIFFAPGTKFQGGSGLDSTAALFVDARDGCQISTIKAIGCQFEGLNGPAIQMQITTSGAVFGEVNDIVIAGNTFRYNLNQSVIMDGVYGYSITGNMLQYCGAAAAPAAEHMYARNSFGRMRDNLTSHDDAVSWPGLGRGITITGANTKPTYLSGNAMGTTTARVIEASAVGLATDSTEQPSTISQV